MPQCHLHRPISYCHSCIHSSDIEKIEKGIGDKVGTLVMLAAQTICCIVIGFYYSWKLTLVILACSPAIAAAAALMDKVSEGDPQGLSLGNVLLPPPVFCHNLSQVM